MPVVEHFSPPSRALHYVRLRILPCQGLLCNTYVPFGPLTWRIEPDQTPPATRRRKSAPKSSTHEAATRLGRLQTDSPPNVIHDCIQGQDSDEGAVAHCITAIDRALIEPLRMFGRFSELVAPLSRASFSSSSP